MEAKDVFTLMRKLELILCITSSLVFLEIYDEYNALILFLWEYFFFRKQMINRTDYHFSMPLIIRLMVTLKLFESIMKNYEILYVWIYLFIARNKSNENLIVNFPTVDDCPS